jgi:hypothetical protein
LNEEFLTGYLEAAGFTGIRPVKDFGLFQDTSGLKLKEIPISLNMVALKPQSPLTRAPSVTVSYKIGE